MSKRIAITGDLVAEEELLLEPGFTREPSASSCSSRVFNRWTGLALVVLLALTAVAAIIVYATVLAPHGLPKAVINAKIFTASLKSDKKWAQAMVIDAHGRLVVVGSLDEVRPYIGANTEVIDAEGKLILPGLIDAHVHPVESGTEYITKARLSNAATVDDLIKVITAYANAHPNLTWVVGTGWALPLFPNANPQKGLLDVIVTRPAYMVSADGHSAWVNSAALAAANITKDTPDPPNGRIERDPATHEPSGTLRESAVHLFDRFLPLATAQDYVEGLKLALALANSRGLTGLVEANAVSDYLRAYKTVLNAGNLTARVTVSLKWLTARGVDQIPRMVRRMKETFNATDAALVQIKAVKLFIDGVMESETAALLKPYLDSNSSGTANFGEEELNGIVTELTKNAFQVHMHAIGDRAVRMGLNAMNASNIAYGNGDLRHTIAHLELIDPSDIPRFKEIGVVANFQPLWFEAAEYITNLTIPVLGPDRSKWLYPFASVWNTGAVCACGSDWDVSSIAPLEGMEGAVMRKQAHNQSSWLPEQRVSVEQAVLCYTRHAAYVAHRDEAGVLEPGKVADFVVLAEDIFTMDPTYIGDTKVLFTYLNGEVVYDARHPPHNLPEDE